MLKSTVKVVKVKMVNGGLKVITPAPSSTGVTPRHTPSPPSDVIFCHHCGKEGFASKSELEGHLWYSHKLIMAPPLHSSHKSGHHPAIKPQESVIHCPKCGKAFLGSQRLQSHMANHHTQG